MLVAIFSEKQSHAACPAQHAGRLAAGHRELHLARPVEVAEERRPSKEGDGAGDAERDGEAGGSALEKYATNLNAAAGRARSIR